MRPVDEAAERAVVGLLLLGLDGAATAFRVLDLGHFTLRETRWVFDVMRQSWMVRGTVPGTAMLLHRLEVSGADQGRVAAYDALLDTCVREARAASEDAGYWFDTLQERKRGRDLLDLLRGGKEEAGILELLDHDKVVAAEAMLSAFAARMGQQGTMVESGGVRDDLYEREAHVETLRAMQGELPGIMTGIPLIDRQSSGLMAEELGLLVAETGTGKTTVLARFACEAWARGRTCLVVSLEVPKIQFQHKIDSFFSGINSDRFRRAYLEGNLSDDDVARWKTSILELDAETQPVILDLPEYATALDIEGHMLELEARRGVRFEQILVDHMGLMTAVNQSGEGRIGWENFSEVSNDLKFRLARKHGKAVWSACQMKARLQHAKKTKGSAGEVIGLASGAAQPADQIVAMTREEEDEKVVEFSFRKHRYGAMHSRERYEVDYGTLDFVREGDPDDV